MQQYCVLVGMTFIVEAQDEGQAIRVVNVVTRTLERKKITESERMLLKRFKKAVPSWFRWVREKEKTTETTIEQKQA